MSYIKTRSANIYKTGSGTYRCRVMVNGVKFSQTFPKFRQALDKRNELFTANSN